MKIVLASNNRGKLAELQAMLAPLGVDLVRQADLGVGEAEEPFRTFVENALAKARFAAAHTGLPALADDAGMCVDAFGGLPGVDTAYYCTQFGYEKSDDNNVRALLEQMQGVDNRRAAMVSTLVAVRGPADPEPLIAVGRVVGEIARAVRQQWLWLRSGYVHSRIWQNLCRAAHRRKKCPQSPGPCNPTDAGAVARALAEMNPP